MMKHLTDIRIFLQVLDLGSISAAALSLGMSPAVASRRILMLEKELGVRLLNRTTRRVSATSEGVELATKGRSLIDELEALTSGLGMTGREVSGTLQVSASVSFGKSYITPLLPEFLKQYPDLTVRLHLSDEKLDLNTRGYDLAIRIAATMDDSELVARKLVTARRLLCAAPDYLQQHGEPASIAELAEHSCLLLISRSGEREHWQLQDKHHQVHRIRVGGPLESNLGEALHDATLRGLGISLLSDWHIEEDLIAGRLKTVLPDYYAEIGIYAVMPQRRFVPLRVRVFTEFLNNQLQRKYKREKTNEGDGLVDRLLFD